MICKTAEDSRPRFAVPNGPWRKLLELIYAGEGHQCYVEYNGSRNQCCLVEGGPGSNPITDWMTASHGSFTQAACSLGYLKRVGVGKGSRGGICSSGMYKCPRLPPLWQPHAMKAMEAAFPSGTTAAAQRRTAASAATPANAAAAPTATPGTLQPPLPAAAAAATASPAATTGRLTSPALEPVTASALHDPRAAGAAAVCPAAVAAMMTLPPNGTQVTATGTQPSRQATTGPPTAVHLEPPAAVPGVLPAADYAAEPVAAAAAAVGVRAAAGFAGAETTAADTIDIAVAAERYMTVANDMQATTEEGLDEAAADSNAHTAAQVHDAAVAAVGEGATGADIAAAAVSPATTAADALVDAAASPAGGRCAQAPAPCNHMQKRTAPAAAVAGAAAVTVASPHGAYTVSAPAAAKRQRVHERTVAVQTTAAAATDSLLDPPPAAATPATSSMLGLFNLWTEAERQGVPIDEAIWYEKVGQHCNHSAPTATTAVLEGSALLPIVRPPQAARPPSKMIAERRGGTAAAAALVADRCARCSRGTKRPAADLMNKHVRPSQIIDLTGESN